MNAREGFKIHSSGVDKYCDPPIIEVHHYSFKTHLSKKDSYMVRVERFPFDLYIVKFFKRNHERRKDKYNVLTNEGIALKIIYTCVRVALDIHRKNPNASFGFVGSPTEKEKENKTLYRTKRFRVYEKFASFFFSPENYEHAAVYEKSGYLILNRRKLLEEANMKESIINMFETTYDIDSLLLN